MTLQKAKRFALIIAVLLGAALFLQNFQHVEKPEMVATQGRTFETATVAEIVRDNLQEDGSRAGDQEVLLQMTSGSQKGRLVAANCPNGLLFGTICEPGMKVIVLSSVVGALDLHTVYNVDRSLPIYLYIGTFLLMLSLIGGKKGMKSAAALVLTFVCFVYLFFPMIFRGTPPVVAAVLTAAVILAATMYLINGWSRKGGIAFLGTLGGVVVSGAAALIFGQMTNLSGYNVSNIESLLFVAQNTAIDVGQLLFAGVLFASLGAVMDIAMDITAACTAVVKENPAISREKLFAVGMDVGRDVMGTMATTLILAFFGGSLRVWVLDYVYDLPYLQLINSNSVGVEIMKGFAGSFGVILTVPLSAALNAFAAESKKS